MFVTISQLVHILANGSRASSPCFIAKAASPLFLTFPPHGVRKMVTALAETLEPHEEDLLCFFGQRRLY